MRVVKLVSVIGSIVILSACGRAQLNGPVAGSDILIDLLGEEGANHLQARTTDEYSSMEEVGADVWERWSSGDKFVWIGNFEAEGFVDAERLYLLQARHGSDVDFDRDGEYDEFPQEILGAWHAIVEGSSLRSGEANVNLLTESVFQFLRGDVDTLGENRVRDWLDVLARELVGDVNNDGSIDYDDVLRWDYSEDGGHFLGNRESLEQLADAIASGASEEEIRQAALELWQDLGISPETLQGRFSVLEVLFNNSGFSGQDDELIRYFLDSLGVGKFDDNSLGMDTFLGQFFDQDNSAGSGEG